MQDSNASNLEALGLLLAQDVPHVHRVAALRRRRLVLAAAAALSSLAAFTAT